MNELENFAKVLSANTIQYGNDMLDWARLYAQTHHNFIIQSAVRFSSVHLGDHYYALWQIPVDTYFEEFDVYVATNELIRISFHPGKHVTTCIALEKAPSEIVNNKICYTRHTL